MNVFFFEIKRQAKITETQCPIRYRSRDEAFKIFLTGAIWDMLFSSEVFDAVNTAGFSLKTIRTCFGLKQNPEFWLSHTSSRLLAHSLRVFYA